MNNKEIWFVIDSLEVECSITSKKHNSKGKEFTRD